MATKRAGSEIVSSLPSRTLPPPLKWAGGKRWLVPHIKPLWEKHSDKALVEPFAGGLAVTLGLNPQRAILNDVNPHLVNFYRWLKRGLTIDLAFSNARTAYSRARSRFNQLIADGKGESSEAVQLFYYLNRTGYNGLCRFNRSGGFNVPFGRHSNIHYATEFLRYSKLLKSWTIINTDFAEVPIGKGDFIYADPPYDVNFTNYSKDGFTWDDQVRLAEWLSKHDDPVVISNQATPRIVRLYRSFGFKLRFLSAPRLISCNGDRSRAREVLATKNI